MEHEHYMPLRQVLIELSYPQFLMLLTTDNETTTAFYNNVLTQNIGKTSTYNFTR